VLHWLLATLVSPATRAHPKIIHPSASQVHKSTITFPAQALTIHLPNSATTGRPHCGYFVPAIKNAQLLRSGCELTILLADIHGFLVRSRPNPSYSLPGRHRRLPQGATN
jgi:hypothetical protein